MCEYIHNIQEFIHNIIIFEESVNLENCYDIYDQNANFFTFNKKSMFLVRKS